MFHLSSTNESLVYLRSPANLIKLQTLHHAMKTYEGVEVQFHAFLTSALVGIKWSASSPGHFTIGESYLSARLQEGG
jgi:hypothetical protein